MKNSFYLGIDTGGTFTDGVLLDPSTRKLIHKTKVLTTHHDLRLCIAEVLKQLIPAAQGRIALVSLSTTLATNAIAEGKSQPVGLFLLGYDAGLVYKFGFDQQFGDSPFFFIPGKHDLNGREEEALDEAELTRKLLEVKGRVAALAISSFAGSRNSAHEDRAGEIAAQSGSAQNAALPVVLGHHLSSNLDSIRRATTARLNASLLSTTYDFLHTVQAMLHEKGVDCPLYVVRGDGSLASASFAARRPVEIIHSGPATSAIGGRYLADLDSALVVDVGGTTTDLTLVEKGHTVLENGEATVGEFRTAVRTIRARSFGMGGDSLIRFDPRGEMSIGPERAVPLSYLAFAYPAVREDLMEWLSNPPSAWYSSRLDYWILRRIPETDGFDSRTHAALELLKNGPMRLSKLLKLVKAVSPRQIDAERLIRQDVITRAGITPTDLLHASGEYAPWDSAVARDVTAAAAKLWEVTPEAFIQRARTLITRQITAEIIQFLSGAPLPPRPLDFRSSDLANFLFDENLAGVHPHLGCQLRMRLPMIGIGAPARAFLPDVARALNTDIFFPDHYEVANAVGAVVGNVLIRHEAEIVPWLEGAARVGFYARTGVDQKAFKDRQEAIAYARQTISDLALAEARAAGANKPELELEERELLAEGYYLCALAAGKPGA